MFDSKSTLRRIKIQKENKYNQYTCIKCEIPNDECIECRKYRSDISKIKEFTELILKLKTITDIEEIKCINRVLCYMYMMELGRPIKD